MRKKTFTSLLALGLGFILCLPVEITLNASTTASSSTELNIISTAAQGGKAFAQFTNDTDSYSYDKVYHLNDGNSEITGSTTPRWSDWKRMLKHSDNYIGILLPRQADQIASVDGIVFTPFKDSDCQKPTEITIQVYVGTDYEAPVRLAHMDELTDHPLVQNQNWRTVKVLSGDELTDNQENIIPFPNTEITSAVRLLMKQQFGKSMAVVELDLYGQYQPQSTLTETSRLISQNTVPNTLPAAIASFSYDQIVTPLSLDRIQAINDGQFGYQLFQKHNRWTNWQFYPRPNDWVGILFGNQQTPLLHRVDSIQVAFFTDYSCKLPEHFKVQYYVPDTAPQLPQTDYYGHLQAAANLNHPLNWEGHWQDVTNQNGNQDYHSILENQPNILTFDPVETYAIRIVMTPQSETRLAVTELQAFGRPLTEIEPPQPSIGNPRLNSFPSIRRYTTTAGQFQPHSDMKMVIAATGEAPLNPKLAETVQLINQEFAAYQIPRSTTMPIIYGSPSLAAPGDILIQQNNYVASIHQTDGFLIDVGPTTVIQAETTNGIMYGLRAIMQSLHLKKAMPYGRITDYPAIAERGLHLDMGRKYFTKQWILDLIKEMSFSRLNTLQLHFSEHEGYRLECETYPDVMSDQYITKAEMREIIAAAQKYGVEIIPAFDSPGHLLTGLRNYPQFWLTDSQGNKAAGSLDINNPEAHQFIKNILAEYAELFRDSHYFHIGGDEFINFNKFADYPSLSQFGQAHVPDGIVANGLDGYTAYINEIADYVKTLGFVPRIWNDGVYRRNMDIHVPLNPDIQICYWTRWEMNMETTEELLNKGHELINVNDLLYYVLTNPGSAYATKPNARKIYNHWLPGDFAGVGTNLLPQKYPASDPRIKGVSYAIWCDAPDRETEAEVSQGIFYSLRAMAEKSWTGQKNGDYDHFRQTLNQLGKARGIDQALPAVEPITIAN